jgi:hypothetical protein
LLYGVASALAAVVLFLLLLDPTRDPAPVAGLLAACVACALVAWWLWLRKKGK